MLKPTAVAASIFAAALLWSQGQGPADPFVEKPYLQLGDNPKETARESLVLMWHTAATPAAWSVQVRTERERAWRTMAPPVAQTVSAREGQPTIAGKDGAKKDAPAPPAIPAHLVYRTRLTNLAPGQEFSYRVLLAGAPVFEAKARARKAAGQPYRFVLFGDCAQGTPSAKAIAYQAYQAKPDFIFVPGDVVYGAGRISEYREKFFPVYNADEPSAQKGAPLLRSIPFIAAPGNHDTALANYARFPDALAYFLYWDQPMNGPIATAAKTTHVLGGVPEAQTDFLAGAATRYPRMANFSFDYGNAHWTVLDSNTYMDWGNAELREWLMKDLKAARGAAFRFVAFHHPGFNSAKEHFTDQWMRQLAPIFEANHVDIVFAGHVHNYQRSFPMRFAPKPLPDDTLVGPKGEVDGKWELDTAFGDGASGKPHGVIYIVSGAGGAGLYSPERQLKPEEWQPFTHKFVSQTHSMSVVDVRGRSLRLRQVSETGEEVDTFQLAK
jgi:acid phosphatase type 7